MTCKRESISSIEKVAKKGVTTLIALGSAASVMLVAGCVTTSSQDALRAEYVTTGNVCATQRAQITGAYDDYSDEITQGVVGGGLAGAAAGLVLGGGLREAAIGGLLGALAGGAMQYLAVQKKLANNDRAKVLDAIDGDAAKDRRRFAQFTREVDALRDCREHEIRRIVSDFQDRRLSQPAAVAALDRQRQEHGRDTDLIQKVFGRVDERATIYVASTAEFQQTTPDTVLGPVAAYRPTYAVSKSSETSFHVKPGISANVRSGPGMQYAVVGGLSGGTPITATGVAGGWTRIAHQGQDAFVSTSLLQRGTAPAPTTRQAQQSVLVAEVRRPRVESERQALFADAKEVQAKDEARDRLILDVLEATEASVRYRT